MVPQHGDGIDTMKQEAANLTGIDYHSLYELPNQQRSFMTSSNSSSSTFKTLQFGDADKVSSSVSILKDTLQRKITEKEATDKSLNGIFCPQEPVFHRKLESSEARTATQEPSQSESSAAAPVVSSGLDACEGFREQIMDNLKDDRKRRSLDRYGSVSMAEAKERNLTPSVPSDMQAVLKRCETLEKEVRSLKFNLSFMNRKDSEQTKQLEDLQRQNKSWQMKKSTS
ncbi:protein CYCLOPS-like [Arachis duranensis]|uniref:Protein CYCLOPS-like n=1 Tax=Arachis duranensis TaxID=130453 RepID=A0A6P4BXF3_ARADU|nr:protein CYCLOPS-like [Arachis duranensis]